MNDLTKKQEQLLKMLYFECPKPCYDGYYFSDNTRMDSRVCRSLMAKGFVCSDNHYAGAGRGLGSVIILTERGETIAESLIYD